MKDHGAGSEQLRGYLTWAAVLFFGWLLAAGYIITLMASGHSDLGPAGDVIVIIAVVVATAYIGWVLWRRRPVERG